MESDSNSVEIVWPPSECSEDEYFVKEEDIDRCVTERIIMDQFHDPLVSSESEQESRPDYIDWDKLFKKRSLQFRKRIFVPGHRPPPRYPRLSELTSKQHYQFLRVISVEYPNVLGDVSLGKPTHQDIQAFEAAKQVYLREQGRYQKWAKIVWGSVHCQRALRPKPLVEAVYEAELKMKAQRMSAFPIYYKVAAHMPLRNPMNNCDAVVKQDLITVPLEEMPNVEIPYNIDKPLFIIKRYLVPEPCPKHPYQTILPNEHALSMLSITDIHRKLATFALNNDTTCIASENALKCFTQWNRHWLLPVSVCETLGPDGNKVNVMVLDSEFSVHKEVAPMRTYKAFRHMLENAFISWPEREKVWDIRAIKACTALEEKQAEILSHASPEIDVSAEPSPQAIVQDVDESSDEDHLFIMESGEDIELPKLDLTPPKPVDFNAFIEEFDSPEVTCSEPTAPPIETDIEVYKCSCEETMFEKPPPRSYRKWSFEKEDTNEKFDIIIHCPHKAKWTYQERRQDDQDQAEPSTSTASTTTATTSTASTSTASTSTAWPSTASTSTPSTSSASTSTPSTSTGSTSTASVSYKLEDKPGELLIEPVPEYQLDLGASEPTPDAVRSVALSLALRENASVLNVRVDGLTGEVVTVDKLTSEAFTQKHPGVKREVISTVHTVINQLQDLRPGHYVLQHEPCHGSNFVLMRPSSPSEEHTLTLNFDSDKLIKTDEAQLAKLPPTITTALLPIHKQRKMLPCAFTPFASLLAKSHKRAPARKKAPPQALRFPKRKRKKINKPSTATTSNVATSNVATSNVATSNVATSNVATSNVATSNVATSNVATSNVATSNVATSNEPSGSVEHE